MRRVAAKTNLAPPSLSPPTLAPPWGGLPRWTSWTGRDAAWPVKALYLGLWSGASSLIILANKQILVDYGFKYPNTLSAMGMLFSGTVSLLLCASGLVPMGPLPTPRFYATRVLPIGAAMAGTMFTGNYAYLFLSVSFVQILKAFTPVATMLGLFLCRMEEPSVGLVTATLMIASGTAVASFAETHWHTVGFISFMFSMVFEAARLILIQVLVGSFSFNAIEALVYMTPACLLFLGAGALVYEREGLLAPGGGLETMAAHPWKFLLVASMGFAVNLTTFLVIQTASSLTLKVVGCIKNALIVYLGVIVYGNDVNPLQLGGYGISLLGFVLYNQAAGRKSKGPGAGAGAGAGGGAEGEGERGGGAGAGGKGAEGKKHS